MPSGAIGDCGNNPSLVATSLVGIDWMLLPSSSTVPRDGVSSRASAQQGGLAAGVGADDDGDLAGRDPHRQVVDDLALVVAEREPVGAKLCSTECLHLSATTPDPVGPSQQEHQVRRTDHAGHDADRHCVARNACWATRSDNATTSAPTSAAGIRPAPVIASAAARSAPRRTRRTRSARPPPSRSRPQDRDDDQHEPRALHPQPEPVAVSSPSCRCAAGARGTPSAAPAPQA